jgi:large subunit ribosomal protein L19e
MNLRSKKVLAASALNVGKNRIYFNPERLSEIKEAITKQDIISLKQDGIIEVKPIHGRKTLVKRKRSRGPGKIKRKVKTRKRDYVRLTRKLRRYLKGLKQKGTIEHAVYKDLRKKIKMSSFKSLSGFKEYIEGIDNYKKVSTKAKKTNVKSKKSVKKISSRGGKSK